MPQNVAKLMTKITIQSPDEPGGLHSAWFLDGKTSLITDISYVRIQSILRTCVYCMYVRMYYANLCYVCTIRK